MLKEFNKKKFLGFLASALIVLGAIFGANNIFTNYKERVIETELLEAAQKYVEGEQISISDTYMMSSDSLINKNLLDDKEEYDGLSVVATNNEGNLTYAVTNDSITDTVEQVTEKQGGIDVPVLRYNIILSNENPTMENVSVQIVFSHDVALSGTNVISGNNSDEWVLSDNNRVLTKTFTENGEEDITVDTAISARPTTVKVNVTNIDKEEITISGIEDGGRYSSDVTISFNKGTALLNGKEITSGTVINTDGNYTLVITDAAGHRAEASFVVAKNPATTDSVQNGEYYTEPVTITFPENVTATLDGKDFTSGTEVSEEGKHTLVLTNPAGVETIIVFTIDLTDPSVVTFAPANTDKTNGNVTVDLVFSEDVKITSINPNYTVTGSGKTYQVTATDNGVITVNYEDLAGRPGIEASYEVTNIDRIPAIISIRNKNTDPTKKAITLVLESNEAIEILESNANFVKYNDASKKFTATVTANGTYTVKVKDLAGNESTASITVTNYDKDKPVVELVAGEANKKAYNLDSLTPVITDANTYTTVLTKDGTEVEYTGTISEEGKYVLTVTDAAGNTRTVNFIIDRTKPVVSVSGVALTDDETYYYNKNVKFKFTDANKPKATLDGNAYKSGEEFDITDKEGSHALIVEDLAGNKTTINFIIDTEPLTATVTPSIPLDTPTNQNVELTITVSKDVIITNTNTDGIEAVGGTLDGFDTNVFKMTATKNNKAVILKFKDKAGNTGSISYTATNIDKNKPVVELISGQKNKTYYKSTLTPTITDENSYVVELTKDGSVVEYTGTIETEGVYSLKVTDAAGNITTVDFTIDKTKPTATVDGVEMTDGSLYNKDIRIVLNDNLTTVTATLDGNAYTSGDLIVAAENEGNHVLELKDASNNKVTINFTIDATAPKLLEIIPSTTDLTNKNITVTFKFDDKVIVTNQNMEGITVSEDGTEVFVTVKNNKNVIVKFKDEAGNTGSASYEVTNIDKTKPTIVVDGVDETGIVYVELGDDTFTLPTATVTDNRDGVLEGTTAPTYTTDESVDVTKEGTTVVTYSATDEAGNTRNVKVTFIVQDTQAPVVTTEIKNSEAIDPITGWSKEALIVTINAEDASAMKYEYMIIASGVEEKWVEVTDPEFSLDLNSSDIQYVVRVTDKSESEHETTVYSTASYKIDKQDPSLDTNEIKSTPTEDGWYKDLNVEVTASDELSGIAKVEYKVSTDNGTTYSEYAEATLTDGVYKFSISTTEESSTLVYKVRVTDKAGNKVVSEVSETLKLDTKAPTVTSITRTPEDAVTPTNQDVVFKIVMSEGVTFDSEDVKPVTGEENTYKITFDENTDGNVVLNYTDKAGNPGNAITLNVSNIDKIGPVITVDGADEKNTIKVELGDTTFVLPEGSATDNVDTSVTVTRDVTTIDVNTVGTTTVTYTATDTAGNKAEKIVKVKVQDTTEPTVTFTVTSDSTPVNNWFNKNIKVQVNADDLSGIKEIRYAILDDDTTSLTPVKLADGVTEFTISNESANISFIVEVEDNEGNVATLVNGAETGTLDVYNLDKTKPVIDKNEITTEAVKGQLYNTDITIEATASDALSGVSKFEYSTTINGVTTDYAPVPEDGIINIQVADGTRAEISYTLKVTDKAGNFKTSTTSGIVVDKEKATITEISRTPDVTVTNTDVVIKFTSSEELSEIEGATKVEGEVNTYEITFTENGSKTITFKDKAQNEGEYTFTVSNIDKTAPVISVDGLDAETNTIKVELGDTTFVVPESSALDNRDGVVTVTKDVETVDVTKVGITTITYTATDEAGNTAERKVKVKVQDTTAPTVTLEITSDSTPINGWYNKDINVKVNATDLSAIKSIEYFYFDTEIGETVSLDLDNPEFTISENKQGIQFVVIVTDEYDNVKEVVSPDAYNLDKKAPTVKHNISTEAEWYTSDITVNVNAKDTLSGIAAATYRLSTDGVNYTNPVALTGTVNETGSIDYEFVIADGYESETLYYEITVTDNAGNSKVVKTDAIKFDKTEPTITVTDPTDNSNLTEGFTKYIELGTVDAFTSMNVTGTDNVTSHEDLTITNKGENKVDVTKVGEYKVTYTVTDKAGNSNEINGTIVVRDTIAPTVRTEIANPEVLTTYGWSKEALKVNIIAEDQNGLTDRLEYYYIVFVDGSSTTEDFVKLPKGTTEFTIDGNSDNISYYVKVVDEGGNEADEVGNVYKIDKQNPSLDSNEIKNEPNEAGWYRSVDVEVTATDTLSGIAKVEYKLSVDGANYTEYAETTLENGVYKFNFAPDKESTTLVYKVRVTDKAGNKIVSEASETIKIDPEDPTVVSITRTPEDATTPTNQDVVFTIVMSEGVTFDNKDVKAVEGEENTYTITFKANTESDVVLNYTDKAGNPGEAITLNVSNIDKTAPVISVDGLDADKNTIKVELGDTTFVVPSATATDNVDTTVTVTNSGTVDVNTVGEYKITYTATDVAGNTAERVVTVKVQDTTAPTVTFTVTSEGTITNGWYNKDVKVKVNATDLSNIEKIEYFLFDETIGEIKELDLDNPEFTISGNYNGIQFLVIVTDEYGNVAEVPSDEAYYIDKLAPTITTEVLEGTLGDNNIYTTNIKVGVTAKDALSGLTELYYKVSVDGGVTFTSYSPLALKDGSFDITDESDNIVYTIKAVDKAGNEIEKTINNIKIDKTAPTITVDGVDETNKLTVELGDNTFTVPEATATDPNHGEVKVDVKGTVDVNTVGDYEITYTAKDAAGNKATRVVTISVVDTTTPEVTITVKNSANEYGWYGEALDVKVKATDLSAIKGYFYKIIDNDVTPEEWTEAKNGEFKVPNEGTNIKFMVKVVDEYDNETVKTSSVYKIDMTKPTVNVVVPSANSYGYYTSNVTVEVNGTDALSGIDYYEYATKTTDGWTEWTLVEDGEFTLTETTKFKVRSVDKAGNTSEAYKSEEIKIDKQAPTLENVTRKPADETTPTNKDVVFTFTPSEEITYTANGDKVIDNTITFTENGTVKVEFIDVAGNPGEYTFTVSNIDKTAPVVTGVEDGEVYTTNVSPTFNEGTAELDGNPYTSGDEISAEGSHKLVVTDDAGNITTVNFVIDKTAPVITVTDLEGTEHTSDFTIEINMEDVDSWKDLEYTMTDEGTSKKDLITNVEGTANTHEPGTYTITYTATDKGNHTTTLTVTVKVIDNENPTVGYRILDYKEGWINNQVQVELNGTDKGTGIEKYEYLLIVDGVEEGSWQEVSKTSPVFTISTNSSDIKFKVRSIDGSNNYSDELTSIETIKIDTELPTVSSTITSTPNENGWYKGGIEVSVSGNDTLSGVKKLEYSIKLGDGSWSDWKEVKDGKFTIKDASDNLTYKVRAIDVAGNKSAGVKSEILKLDTTKPVITVMNGEKGETKDFNITLEADKTVTEFTYPTVSVEDNDKTVTVTRTGNVDMKLLDTPQEVIYSATDIAGNNTTVKMTVTIKDTTAPTVTLKVPEETSVKYGTAHNVSASDIEVSDNFDENPTVEIESKLDVLSPDTYVIKYIVTDQSGKVTTVTRTVIVTVATTKDIILSDGVTSTNEACTEGVDCYINKGDNNFVWYSGHLWRIIKVNSDGTVKLVTEEVVAGFSFDDDSSAFIGSHAEEWLNEEFYRELNNTNELIVESEYCNEQLNSLKKKRYTCSDSAKVKAKVALLTVDEYNILGGANSYLNNGTRFHTMTPTGPKTAFIVEEDGNREYNLYVNEPYGMRPVITTKALDITKGTGTKEDPYHVKGDNKASKGSNLNDRVSGEYVTFANQTWRIVETQGTGTKLIYDGYYTVDGLLDRQQFGAIKFTTEDGIGSYLNNSVYNSLFTNENEKNVIEKSRWYSNEYHIGDNPVNTTLKSSNNFVDAYVGLIRVGELMSGNSTTGTINNVSTWTLNNNGTKVWQASWAGTTDIIGTTEDYRTIRPVIVINSDVKIAKGNGTIKSPYTLELGN